MLDWQEVPVPAEFNGFVMSAFQLEFFFFVVGVFVGVSVLSAFFFFATWGRRDLLASCSFLRELVGRDSAGQRMGGKMGGFCPFFLERLIS